MPARSQKLSGLTPAPPPARRARPLHLYRCKALYSFGYGYQGFRNTIYVAFCPRYPLTGKAVSRKVFLHRIG
jgi:hypothetical protein